MSSLSEMIERFRGLRLEAALGLRPVYPHVALELDQDEITLVRLKRKRGQPPVLDGHYERKFGGATVPSTIYDPVSISIRELGRTLGELFEEAGVRAGRVSLVLPDNLAKISLLSLPERPSSRKQLDEVVRFKMRRAVPFRLSEAALAYQILPGEHKETLVLVAATRRSMVEQYEKALEMAGARPGLVDLCTPNLLNLCRAQIESSAGRGGDVAVLNCAPNYFSLAIVRQSRLIFLRCKTYSMAGDGRAELNGLLSREVAGSISYYEEKLQGKKIGTLLVRSGRTSFEEVAEKLGDLDVDNVESLDPAAGIRLEDGGRLDPSVAGRIAAVLGAAMGRG